MTTPSTAAVVTGCSSGIGRAVALRLADAGYPVYATARRVEALGDLADAGLVTMPLDLDDETSMVAAVERVVDDHGAVGVLVATADIALPGPVVDTPLDDVRRQFETGVFGLVRLTQLVLPGMRRQGYGRVVAVGPSVGGAGLPGGGLVTASRHALEGLSDSLRREVETFGVHVALVQPGHVVAGGSRPARSATSPEQVASVVVAAVRSRRPRTRYPVGLAARTLDVVRRAAEPLSR